MGRRILILLIVVMGALLCLAFVEESEKPWDTFDVFKRNLPPILDVEVENFSVVGFDGRYECEIVLNVANPNDYDVSLKSIDVFVSDENGNPVCMRKVVVDERIPSGSVREIELKFSVPAVRGGFLVFEGFVRGKAHGQDALGTFRKIVQIK